MSILSYLKRIFAFLSYTFLILFVVLLGSIAGLFFQIKRQLPDLNLLEEYEPSQITRVYASEGEPLAYFCLEKRTLVPYSSSPKHLTQAIIAVEDAGFYRHKGLDWEGITRAALRNLKHRGFVEGGSTITQQLTRSLLLHSGKTIIRKIKEALLALELEKTYSKEKILEMYLNQIYLGNGAYGVESAAKTFFGKPVEALSVDEAAVLAGLPKAPNIYNPYRHPERALIRRNYVLKRMLEEGFIDNKTYHMAIDKPIGLIKDKDQRVQAPYFVEYVRSYLEERYGANTLYRGGLKVYTTLDLRAQELAEEAVRWGIEELDKRQGFRRNAERKKTRQGAEEALTCCIDTDTPTKGLFMGELLDVTSDNALINLEDTEYIGLLNIKDASWTKVDSLETILYKGDRVLVKILDCIKDPNVGASFRVALDQEPEVQASLITMDTRNGYIKAMVGGYDFSISKFNRAVQARRQPGSSFKPFIYSTALKQGYTLTDIFIDSPIIYQDESQDKDWKPVNYYQKFYGPTTLREALEKSRNVITIKLLKKVGIEPSIETARKLGISSPLAPDLSLALGSSGVSLLELTSAYGVFATEGIRSKPIAILRVEGPDGKILEENSLKQERVLDEKVAYLMTQALRGVVEHGTGWRAKVLGRPVGGKTGTTNNYIDAWFLGFTPSIVTGVWTGYDEYKSLGEKETGSRAAAPIWVRYMKGFLEDKPVEDFPIPNGIKLIPIDKKSGLLATPESPNILIEAFIEGNEPREYYDSKKMASEHFVSIDMDLSTNDEKDIAQRRDINRPEDLVYSSD